MAISRLQESREIFADFTMSRIDSDVRESLTDKQMLSIRHALIAQSEWAKHKVDVRFTLPLFFAKYYFILLSGRDRRKKTRLKEVTRSHKGNFTIGFFITLLMFSVISALFWLFLIIILYWLKVELGIDVFPNFHISDFLSVIMNVDEVSKYAT